MYSELPKSQKYSRPFSFYFSLFLLLNSLLWSFISLYILFSPKKFTSSSVVLLTGQQGNSTIDLNSIGAISSNPGSSFGSQLNIDPRASYKEILEGDEILVRAANILKIEKSSISKPKVKLLDPSAAIRIEVNSDSPIEARDKAIAINQAFQDKLNSLRTDEIKQRQKSVASSLNEAKERLVIAQSRLYNFKQKTGLLDPVQVTTALSRLDTLSNQRADILSQYQSTIAQYLNLQSTLGRNPEQVVNSFSISSDPILQANLKNYSDSLTTYQKNQSSLTEENPIMISLKASVEQNRKSTLNRASQLVGRSVTIEELTNLVKSSSSTNDSKQSLYADLIKLRSSSQGLYEQLKVSNNEVLRTQEVIRQYSTQQPIYQNLEREVKLAEIVYTSTLAKTDVVSIDIFNTYPLAQTLAPPSLPSSPSSPKVLIALAAGTIASILSSSLFLPLLFSKKKVILNKEELNPKHVFEEI